MADFLCCHLTTSCSADVGKEAELHFFSREVSPEAMRKAERAACDAEMFGTETLGVIRAPLYTYRNRAGKGLPAFLSNAFAGNARAQLLYGLYAKDILGEQEIRAALEASSKAT